MYFDFTLTFTCILHSFLIYKKPSTYKSLQDLLRAKKVKNLQVKGMKSLLQLQKGKLNVKNSLKETKRLSFA